MTGHIRERKGLRGSSWQYSIDLPRPAGSPRAQEQRGGFKSRRAAEVAMFARLAEVSAPGWREAAAVPTFADLAARWLAQVAATKAPATHANYETQLRRHLLPAFGSVRIDRLSPLLAETYYAEALSRGLARSTVGCQHKILAQILKRAVRWGLLEKSPLLGAEPPRRREPAWRILTAKETRLLLDASFGTWAYLPIVLGVATGMRRGEVLALRWEDVALDPPRGSVAIRRSVSRVSGVTRYSKPKGGKEHTISLPPFAVLALATAERTGELVCGDERGRPVNPSTHCDRFHAALAAAGLPRMRFHNLRHSHTSLLLAAGVPVKTVQERLGHSSPSITLGVYAHSLPGDQERAASEVQRLFSPLPAHAPVNTRQRARKLKIVTGRVKAEAGSGTPEVGESQGSEAPLR